MGYRTGIVELGFFRVLSPLLGRISEDFRGLLAQSLQSQCSHSFVCSVWSLRAQSGSDPSRLADPWWWFGRLVSFPSKQTLPGPSVWGVYL